MKDSNFILAKKEKRRRIRQGNEPLSPSDNTVAMLDNRQANECVGFLKFGFCKRAFANLGSRPFEKCPPFERERERVEREDTLYSG